MKAFYANRPVPCPSAGAVASATVSRSPRKLPAVKRSLAGLPVHRAPGGLLVVPVLQPVNDHIPFGLALSWQRQTGACLPASSDPALQTDLYELQYVLDGQGELCGKSGMLQSITSGDSILCPIGKAWCQLGSGTNDSDLAVLKLLVPGSLPNNADAPSQGVIDGASQILNQWQTLPIIGSLAAQTVQSLLMGAKNQAVIAADNWQSHAQTALITNRDTRNEITDPAVYASTAQEAKLSGASANAGTSTSAGTSTNAGTSTDAGTSISAGTSTNAEASVPWRDVQLLLPKGLPKQANQLFRDLAASSHKILSSIGKSRLADVLWPDQCVVKKKLAELSAFQLPNQTNRLALMFDPLDHQVPFTFGLEIFEMGHKTKPHTHPVSHELFFILAGDGTGFCDDETFPVTAGDVVVFPPTSVHGIDNGQDSRMYCLELMLPNDMFAEFVRQGQPTGKLRDDDMCIMIAQGCTSG